MHDGVEIVHQHPTGIQRAFGMGGHGVHFLFHFFVNAVGNSFDVRIGVSFANDEKICRGIIEPLRKSS
jgi:hypothetical protein